MSEITQQKYEGSNQLLIEAQEVRDLLATAAAADKLDIYYRLAAILQRIDSAASLAVAEEGLLFAETLPDNAATAEGKALLWLIKGLCYFYQANTESASAALEYVKDLLGEHSEAAAAVRATNLRGVIDVERGRYVSALNHYDAAYSIAVRRGYRRDEFNSLVNIGNAYNRLDQMAKAIETYLQALAVAEKVGDQRLKAKVFGNIATAYSKVHEFEKELEYCQSAYEIHQETGDLLGQSLVLANIAYASHRMGNYADAYTYYKTTLALKQEIGDVEHQPVAWLWLAMTCDKLGYHDEALSAVERSLEISLSNGAFFKHAAALNFLSDLLYSHGRDEESLETLDKCIEICHEHNFTVPVVNALQRRYKILKKAERWQEAAETAEKVVEVTEEMRNRQEQLQRDTMQAIFDMDRAHAIAATERSRNEELAVKDKELHERNAELERLNEDKNELLRIVAHDLKNPLSAITMIAKLLKNDEHIAPGERKELFDDILTTAERMFILINDLLNLEELERGTLKFQSERVSANDMLASVCRQTRKQADSKNITLEYNPSKVDIFLRADEGRLRQLIENLLSNALKFSPKGSMVQISVERRRGNGRITVKDHGPGINDADKERLFQKFARLTARPTGGEHSSGLGLAIAKKITDAMGGTIHCESKVGKGATFIVELPLFQSN